MIVDIREKQALLALLQDHPVLHSKKKDKKPTGVTPKQIIEWQTEHKENVLHSSKSYSQTSLSLLSCQLPANVP